jgi:L-lactate dehydrogenase complex protein LldF
MLYCIRCAACLNICPVYGKIGGHTYGHPYSGPVGAVVLPLFAGINEARHLCQGETLCGACQDACPVNIDLPRMLLALRAKLADGDPDWGVQRASKSEKAVFKMWSWMIRSRPAYEFLLRVASFGQKLFPENNDMIRRLPAPFNGWTQHRDIRPIADKSFMQRWRKGL